MATNSNNITIKLKVDGSEDAVKAVNNVKASVDQITKAQADLIKQKTKEIELDGALRRSLEARGKILKEDMQKARIDEYKSMQQVLRAERDLGSEIKRRAGEIANARKASHAEVMDKRDQVALTRDLTRLDRQRALDRLAILKQEANVQSANHRAEINRIKAEKAARNEASGGASSGPGGRRQAFFTPVVQAVGAGFNLPQKTIGNISGALDFLGRANLALLVLSKSLGSIGQLTDSMIQASLAADKYRLKMVSLEVVTRNNNQTFGQAYQTFMKFNDGLQSEDSLITATRTFSTLGISTDQTRQLIDGLRNGIVAMGGDVSEQLPLMALAFKRQESALLDNAGITSNLDIMYKEYAKTIGTTVDKLTTQQKVQASIVGSLKELNQYQGLSTSRADSLTGAFDRQKAMAEKLNRALGVAATPVSTLALATKNAFTQMSVDASAFFAMLTGGFSQLMNSPEYQMFLGGRFASGASIGGERTGQAMGLAVLNYTKIGNKDLEERAKSSVDAAEKARDIELRRLASELGTTSTRIEGEIVKRQKNTGFKLLFDRYLDIIDMPAEAVRKLMSEFPSAEQASRAATARTGITYTMPGRTPVIERFFSGTRNIQGVTEDQRSAIQSEVIGKLEEDRLNAKLSIEDQINSSKEKTGKTERKNSKQAFEDQLKLLKESMQQQKSVKYILEYRERIANYISKEGKSFLNAARSEAMTLQVNQDAQNQIEASIKRTSQEKNIQLRISRSISEINEYSVNTTDEELNQARDLVNNYKERAKELNIIKSGLGDVLLQSSAYADALDTQLRLTKNLSDANAEAYGDKQQSRLDKMIQAHSFALVNKPFGEYEAYSQLVGKLESDKSSITGTDKESEQKKEQIQKVINDATGKMNESLKEAFNRTSDIIKSGIEKTVSVITSAFSGNVIESLNLIGQEVFNDSIKSLSDNLAKNKSIMKSVEESKDALNKALAPIGDFVANNIAKPLIDGLTSGLNILSQMAPIAQFGIVAAFTGLIAVGAILLDSFIKMEQKSKEIAENTKNAIEYSIPRQVREQRSSIYGFEMRGPVASSELTDIETKMEEARKRVENDKRMRDESGMNLIAYAWHNKNAKEAQHELDKLAESYIEIEKKADEYNDQLNREAALKSSKEMLYDLDQQIAEMNIDNALKMGQITQEEADRQKKLLEIEQKKKELTDQAVDIATGFVDQSVLRKYKDNPQQFQADLSAAVQDFGKTGNTKGLEALGITGEEITGPGGLAKVFEKIGMILSGMGTSANMPGSSPDKPMYTQVVNVKDFRLAFPDSAYFRAPAIATTTSSGVSLNANRTNMGL